MKRHLLALLTLIAALSLVATGCGDDSSGGDSANNSAANNSAANNNPANNNPANNNPVNNNPVNNNPANNNPVNNNPVNNNPVTGTPEDYTGYSSKASYINTISIETNSELGDDVDGDGDIDNALGSLLNSLSGLLGDTDINATLQESIDEGSLALGMTWPGVTDPASDTTAALDFFQLQFATAGDASAFLADRDSFDRGSSTPLIRFQTASFTGGALEAGPSTFNISIPLSDTIQLALTAERARIKGDASLDALGIKLTDGTLSGAVPLVSVAEALNAYISSDNCSCVTGGDLIDTSGGAGDLACNALDASNCSGDQDICGTIVGACGIAIGIIGSELDIDLDGDGQNDALSVFIRMEAQGTVITGPAAD